MTRSWMAWGVLLFVALMAALVAVRRHSPAPDNAGSAVVELGMFYRGARVSTASGVVVSPHHVLMNWHALNMSDRIEVIAIDGTTWLVAGVTNHDARLDVVSVKLEQSWPYAILPMASSDPVAGEAARLVVRSDRRPFHHEVMTDVMCALTWPDGGRSIEIGFRSADGQSGSPLLNLRGEVCGVLSSSSGMRKSTYVSPVAGFEIDKPAEPIARVLSRQGNVAVAQLVYESGLKSMARKEYRDAIKDFQAALFSG